MHLLQSLSNKQQTFNFFCGRERSVAIPWACRRAALVCRGGRALSSAEARDLPDPARALIEAGRFRYEARRELAPSKAGYLVFDALPSV
jgi:hypothetical protein